MLTSSLEFVQHRLTEEEFLLVINAENCGTAFRVRAGNHCDGGQGNSRIDRQQIRFEEISSEKRKAVQYSLPFAWRSGGTVN